MYINREQINKLAKEYSTPIYLYDKNQIIENIKQIKQVSSTPNLHINYATKANSNLNILKLIKDQGLNVDCTGYGEYFINKHAGFTNDNIYVVANNLTDDELSQLAEENVTISVDSYDQLVSLNKVVPSYQKVMLRINPTFGDGENASIITGGHNHKFGIDYDKVGLCLNFINDNDMKLIGINQHIGSLNLNYKSIVLAVQELINFITTSSTLPTLEIINFGGGFGIDYNHQRNTKLDFASLKLALDNIFKPFLKTYSNPNVRLEFEPGRYIVANSAVTIGTVTSVKKRGKDIYIGTDIGFSQLVRPVMYDSHHHIEFVTNNELARPCHVVGNMCESGDYLCKKRKLIIPEVGELVIVYDTGAYGYSMASNFNNRLRPIEIMIDKDRHQVIRNRERLNDLLLGYNNL